MKRYDVNSCVEDLKRLKGLPPYDGPSNIVCNDGYFAQSIEQDYCIVTRQEADRIIEHLTKAYNAMRQEFIEIQLPDPITLEQELAGLIHKKQCRSNHTDQCGWDYGNWDDKADMQPRPDYLEKASNILEITSFDEAKKILELI